MVRKTLTNILIGASLIGNLSFNSSCNYEKPKTKQIEKQTFSEDTLTNKAIEYYYKGNYELAKNNFQKYLEIKTSKNDSQGIANGFNNLGLVLSAQGKYNEATENYTNALKIYENLSDSLNISKAYNNLGLVFDAQKKNDKALEYLRKDSSINSEILSREPKNTSVKTGLSITLITIGTIFDKQKDYDKALKYYFSSLEIANKTSDKMQQSICFNNIGEAYRKKGNLSEAFDYYNKSIKINKELDDKEVLAFNLLNLGLIYSENKNHSKAIESLEKADSISLEIGNPSLQKDIYENFSLVYKEKKDYKKSLEYHVLFSEMKDFLINEESLKQVAELETIYQTEKKENENKLLKKDNQIIEEKNQKQRWGLLGLGAFLGLAGIFSYSLYKSRKKIHKAKEIIEEKNKEITDSMNYAKNIQKSILPRDEEFNRLLPENFVLYKPKDIVSGDFYWLTEKLDKIYFAACDCTGHGVPGAFMSMLNSKLLDNAINEKQIEKPNEIFNYARNEIINSLKSKGEIGEQKDGMDAVLCALDKKNNLLEFACANNSLYLIRNNELIEHKGDKMPVGYSDNLKDFSLKKIALQKNDLIYISSDGYGDQFGGPNEKKFMKKNLKELLLSINQKPMSEQKEILNKTIEDWMAHINPKNKKPYEQTDDLCVIGLRI